MLLTGGCAVICVLLCSRQRGAARKARKLLCEQDPDAPGLTMEQRRKIRRWPFDTSASRSAHCKAKTGAHRRLSSWDAQHVHKGKTHGQCVSASQLMFDAWPGLALRVVGASLPHTLP